MDITPIIFPILATYWWLPLLIVAVFVQLPLFKGYLGESLVRFLIWLNLDKDTYRRLHNVTIPSVDGTTQIDHILVSPFGIFVIETKNLRGWIFGSVDQDKWTQRIFRNSYKFQNPLRQNFKHLKAIEMMLGISLEQIHSAIVFVGDSTFKTPMPANVTYATGLVRYIRSFTTASFTESQVEQIFTALQNGRRAPTLETHREHVRNLVRRRDVDARRLCPECGNTLVIRTVKSGAKAGSRFWGCSTFPKCRVTQKVV